MGNGRSLEVSLIWKGLDVTAEVWIEDADDVTPGSVEIENIALWWGHVELSDLGEYLSDDKSLREAILREVQP